jgi:ATP-independent RNA helicase DbpA
MGPQLASLKRDPHIVVGTPGRILKHLEIGTLKLNRIETLVLDEADRMLDMGFYDDILNIINVTPLSRQTLLFSATYPEKIKQVSDRVQIKPKDIRIESSHDIPEINQIFFEVDKSHRIKMVYKLISHYELESILIFCNTKLLCQQLVTDLKPYNINALALHGDLEQFERDQILTQFSSKACSVLIATDVAARGIDVTDLSAVINYELSFDPELHIHRIGRTGRAGAKGLALSLFSNNERQRLETIEEYQGKKINIKDTDSLSNSINFKLYPPMALLFINGGKKEKLRAGDLLGALTANDGITAKQVGKITLFDKFSYVAIDHKVAKLALTTLNNNTIKGRKFRVRIC